MRRVLGSLIVSCLLATAAQADHIGLYRDPQGTCNAMVPVTSPALTTVYIVQKLNEGSLGVAFKIVDNSVLIPAAQTSPYLTLGEWNVDWSFGFEGCVVGDHMIATLSFLWLGDPIAGCSRTLQVAPGPTSSLPGEIVVADCASYLEVASGGTFYFEGSPLTCGDVMGCLPLPVQSPTWGAVKALYR